MEFPQYRKYKNNLSYFKIHGLEHFTEYKKFGSAWEKIEIVAKILPDRNYIADMLNDYEQYWDKIEEEDFEKIITSA